MAVKRPIPHRQRQARATREEVASAARRLFAARGYITTTIQAISAAADIPAATIYSAFGSKPAILEEVRQLWIAESDVQDLHRRALATPDPSERLRLAAHWTRRQFELGYEVIAMYQEAAQSDSGVAAVWRGVLAGRETAVRELLGTLREHLRPNLMPTQALDLYITCTLPEMYRTLVLERGWSLDTYEHWLADLLIWQLGPPPGHPTSSRNCDC